MRIAILQYAQDDVAARARAVSVLLRRGTEELALGLASLDHHVLHLTVVAGATRVRSSGRSRRTIAAVQHANLVCATARPGQELSAIAAARPDVVLGVGPAAAQALELLAEGLRSPWVWAAEPAQQSAVGSTPTLPTTASRFVTQSRYDADTLVSAGLSAALVDVVPWRLSADVAGPASTTEVPLRSRSVLAVADVDHDGMADTIRALSLLPDHQLVVAVDARQSQDQVRSRSWLQLAAGLGAASRVRVVPVQSVDHLRHLLDRAGLLLSVPRTGFQRELVSAAMWCGTPVVVSDQAGARELLETGSSGLLLPAADPRRLARAVGMVTTDARGRGAWAWAARRRIRDTAAPVATVRAMSDVLQLVASGRAPARSVRASIPVQAAG